MNKIPLFSPHPSQEKTVLVTLLRVQTIAQTTLQDPKSHLHLLFSQFSSLFRIQCPFKLRVVPASPAARGIKSPRLAIPHDLTHGLACVTWPIAPNVMLVSHGRGSGSEARGRCSDNNYINSFRESSKGPETISCR